MNFSKHLMICLLMLAIYAFPFSLHGQDHLWKAIEEEIIVPGEQRIQPEAFSLFQVDFARLQTELRQAPIEAFDRQTQGLRFPLPMPDGSLQEFELFMTWVLSEQDSAKYPDIRTFIGHGIDDPYAYARLDFTPHGFHAMILSRDQSRWIDPYVQGNTAYYMAYRKGDLQPRADEDYICHNIDPGLDLSGIESELRQQSATLPVGPELRVYDLALTCVGEYGVYHGGTVPLAQAAIVTSINRVTGIFERDMSARLVLIPNNDTLIFVDPNTDPFDCCNLGPTINRGAEVIDSLIGAANFDVGHTYCTYGGGAAAFGLCESDKAVAATGLNNPVGDPFDVDYVSHEIGHQFFAAHTFNYCPGQGGVPHEPGSGSTIMAYAGLCGTANIQTFSVDAFSVGTYEQSVTYTTQGFGNSCATIINTGNHAPLVAVPEGGFYIPRATPFELTASGSDLDGDSLTYSWEQWDFGPNAHPDSSVGDVPLFRVLWSTPDSQRIFPQISDLVQGTQTIGEQLPAYGRTMTFRCAIRDNQGGADFDQMQFFVADSAGPFKVTYPNVGVGFWTVGSIQNVSWDVARSDLFPVNCRKVDIYLSTDGGYTYPILLAADRPNTGATAITVPNITGSNMRIKIKGAGNHFFDISDADFAILPAATPDYILNVPTPVATICGQDTIFYIVGLDTLGTFTDSIALSLSGQPQGTGFSFSNNPTPSPDSVLLKVWNGTAAAGDYSLNLQASSSSGVKTMPLSLRIRTGSITAVSPISPFNGSTNAATSPVFSWNAVPLMDSYRLQVSLSPDFANPILDVNGLNATSYPYTGPLDNNQIYYWRVKVDTADCGAGPWGAIYSFQTPLISCSAFTSTDIPVSISPNDVDTVYSTISVPDPLIITDVNVMDLQGVHTWMGDLGFYLNSPQGTQVHLFGFQCGDQDDFAFSFDDTSSLASVPCPPTTGLVYQPVSPLSALNAEDAQGDWTLEVIDRFAADGGEISQWGVEICGPITNVGPPSLVNQLLTITEEDSSTISDLYLDAMCSDSGQATYTLVSLPAFGTLLLDTLPLAPGDTFSQAQIDAGLLSYDGDTLSGLTDAFQFTLSCSNGGFIGGLSFSIAVNLLPPLSIAPEKTARLTLYPNPAREAFQLKVEGAAPGQMELVVFDLLGKRVLEQEAQAREMMVPVQALSRGLYTVVVWINGELIGTRKLIRE